MTTTRRIAALALLLVLVVSSSVPVAAGPAADIRVLTDRVTALEARVTALEARPSASPTPTPTAVPTATPTIAPTPTPAPVSGWREVWSDDFTVWDPSRYNIYPTPWKDSSQNGTYGYPIIASDGAKLRVHLHTENGIRKVASFSPRVGYMDSARIEFRLRADVMRGYKMAPLFWPQSEVWPRDGEIDFPEGDFTGGTVSAFMHRQGATVGSDQDWYGTTAKHTDWHTYRIDWIDGVSVEFFVDGVSIGRSTARVPNTPMRFQFQFETSLSGIIPDPATQGYVEIDYVRIWVPA